MDERTKKVVAHFNGKPDGKLVIVSRADMELALGLFNAGFQVRVSDRNQDALDAVARVVNELPESLYRFSMREHCDADFGPHDLFLCGDMSAPHPVNCVKLK